MTRTHSQRMTIILGFSITIVTLASSFATESQRPGRQRRSGATNPVPVPDEMRIKLPAPEPEPAPGHLGFRVSVNPDLPLPEVQESLAARLRQANPTIPMRLAKFSYLDNPNVRLDGWGGRILNFEPILSGWIVTIRVTPLVTTTYGASTTMVHSVHEKYEFNDSGFRCLSVVDDPIFSGSGSFLTD